HLAPVILPDVSPRSLADFLARRERYSDRRLCSFEPLRAPVAYAPGAPTGAQKYVRAPLRKPGRPSILTGPVHPFGSLAALSVPPSGRLRAHSFASPPHDGFAFVEDDGLENSRHLVHVSGEKLVTRHTANL